LSEITEDIASASDLRCLRTASGEEYIGHVNRTLSGIRCQKWSENSPHEHGYLDISWFADYATNPRFIIHDVENYCRNPSVLSSSDARPWCFTTSEDIEYEFCDIPRCKCKAALRDIYE